MAPHIALREVGTPFEARPLSFARRENHDPAYLAINPEGKVPTLLVEGRPLTEVAGILFYLARRYGAAWLPADDLGQARVLAWLTLAANELANGPAALRVAVRFKRPLDVERATAVSKRAFGLMQQTLAAQPWLVQGPNPTIADVACFPYTALAHEGNLSLAEYPAIVAWCDRIRALPGFVAMEGI